MLYWQSSASLDYINEIKSNPLVVLIKEEPLLLSFLLRFFNDIKVIEYILLYIQISSILIFLIGGLGGLIYLAVIPHYMHVFTEELVSKIKIYLSDLEERSSKGVQMVEEIGKHSSGEEALKEESQITSIYCSKRTSNVMLCDIVGRNISLDPVRRALIFLGFRIIEESPEIIVGEKDGSFFADKFLAKKINVRVLSLDKDRIEVLFETSIWIGFTDNDCKEAEELLKIALSKFKP